MSKYNTNGKIDGEGGTDKAKAQWPWADKALPLLPDLGLGVSRTYKTWRQSHNKSIEELPGRATWAHKFTMASEETEGKAGVEASSPRSSAGQKATKKLPAGSAKQARGQTEKSSPATKVAAKGPARREGSTAPTEPPAPKDNAQVLTLKRGVKASAKPPAALSADIEQARHASQTLALGIEARKREAQEEVEKTRAAEHEALEVQNERHKQAGIRFNEEIARIRAKEPTGVDSETSNNAFSGSSWDNEVDKLREVGYFYSPGQLPVREPFGARREEPVKACPIPLLSIRQTIWDRSVKAPFNNCFLGPFEIAIPKWLDFHDLVLHDFDRVKKEKLVRTGLVIAWRIENGRPVSLVVGPDPSIAYDEEGITLKTDDFHLWTDVRSLWTQIAEWLVGAYRGSCFRLADFLHGKLEMVLARGNSYLEFSGARKEVQSQWNRTTANPCFAFDAAKYRRDKYDRWMPEVYAILSQPRTVVGALLQDWIRREPESYQGRFNTVRDIWTPLAFHDAHEWCHAMGVENKQVDPSPRRSPASQCLNGSLI